MTDSVKKTEADIVIVGGGIVGLAIAREFALRRPGLRITLLEKEASLAQHASGRNSGVIHAGFYYTPDSLKARLTAEGNRLMTGYCLDNGIDINRCGKVVVAKDEKELRMLHELKARGDKNGVELSMVDEAELGVLEPNARTFKKAIYSPTTATVNPAEVVRSVAANLDCKVDVSLGEGFVKRSGRRVVQTTKRRIEYKHLINAAGLYADRVAHEFGAGKKYALLPFKGLYMGYSDDTVIGKHIYPVPDLENPFLGVHFTRTVDGHVKIGPTATPAFWRENYEGLRNFRLGELVETLSHEARLFARDSFGFRKLAFEEMKKYWGRYLIKQAARLVKRIDPAKFSGFSRPGIRAQLLDTGSMRLVSDFVVEHAEDSTHILNAVSPAFTCSFSFAGFVADDIEKRFSLFQKRRFNTRKLCMDG